MKSVKSDYSSAKSRSTGQTSSSKCLSCLTESRFRQAITAMLVSDNDTQDIDSNEHDILDEEDVLSEHKPHNTNSYIVEHMKNNINKYEGNTICYTCTKPRSVDKPFAKTSRSQSDDKRKVSLYTENKFYRQELAHQNQKEDERRASFIPTERKGLEYAEKTTYCRPVFRYNQEHIYKFTKKKQKLQMLVQKIIEAREKEKQITAWDEYIKDLKQKHDNIIETEDPQPMTPLNVDNNAMPPYSYVTMGSCDNDMENDYKTIPSHSSYCNKIIKDLYDSDSCRDFNIMELLRKNTAVNTDTNQLNLPLFYEPNPYFCYASSSHGRMSKQNVKDMLSKKCLGKCDYAGQRTVSEKLNAKDEKSYRNERIVIPRSRRMPPRRNVNSLKNKKNRKQQNMAQTDQIEDIATQTEDSTPEKLTKSTKTSLNDTKNNIKDQSSSHSDEHSPEKKGQTLKDEFAQISDTVAKLKEKNDSQKLSIDSKVLESIENKLDLLIIAINSLILNYKALDLGQCTDECISRKPFSFDQDTNFGDLLASDKKKITNKRCNLSDCTSTKCRRRRNNTSEGEAIQNNLENAREHKPTTTINHSDDSDSDNDDINSKNNDNNNNITNNNINNNNNKGQQQKTTRPGQTSRSDIGRPTSGQFKMTTELFHSEVVANPDFTNNTSENIEENMHDSISSISKLNNLMKSCNTNKNIKLNKRKPMRNIMIQNDRTNTISGTKARHVEKWNERLFFKNRRNETIISQNSSVDNNFGYNREDRFYCGVVDEDINPPYLCDTDTSKIDRILIEEMDKSDQAKRDIEDILNGELCCPRAVQINIDVPTRERCTEVTDSLSRTRLTGEIMPEFAQNYVSSCNRTITIAVNTDPLGLLALFRISTDTIRELLSHMQRIDYYSYLPSISKPMPRQLMSSEDLYYCHICGANFTKVSQLSKHLQNHQASSKDCCVCRHLLDVQKRRNPVGLFSCQFCGQCFTRAYCRELHEQTCARKRGCQPDVSEDLAILS